MNTKYIIILLVLIFGAAGFWLFREVTRPLPGEELVDLGQDHSVDISEVEYNSNPPTSGTHFPVWAKRGVYDRILSDGYLVHSLEHGYIVISYNCERPITSHQSLVTEIFAHETDEPHEEPEATQSATESGKPLTRMLLQAPFTPQNPPAVEVELSESFKSENCKNLVNDLSRFLEEFERVVVVPRPNMDTLIATTAWRKLNTLESFDKDKIREFIKIYHNKGPEQTME